MAAAQFCGVMGPVDSIPLKTVTIRAATVLAALPPPGKQLFSIQGGNTLAAVAQDNSSFSSLMFYPGQWPTQRPPIPAKQLEG